MIIPKEKWLNEKNFFFRYGETDETDCTVTKTERKTVETEDELTVVTRYSYDFGVDAVRTATFYKKLNAAYFRLRLENHSGGVTQVFSDLCDFRFDFPFEPYQFAGTGYFLKNDNVRLITRQGSRLRHDEFLPAYRYLYGGYEKEYDNGTARSSDGLMPYFQFDQKGCGAIVAVGWSGNWRAHVKRTDVGVEFSSGIAKAAFRMYPDESFDLSSALVSVYEGGWQKGQNAFRDVMKYRCATMGHIRSEKDLPFSMLLWGAMPSDEIVRRVETVKKAGIPVNYLWLDAGWYGYSDDPCLNAHEGDWGAHTGNWVINEKKHPDQLLRVRDTLERHDMKFLLWFEPERVVPGTLPTEKHPERYRKIQGFDGSWLTDLGNDAAWQETFDMLSSYIEKLHLSCYRQDFNMDPLAFFEQADEPLRQGVTQIRHINGLYRLWDALLEKYPHLIIDNCASGGRRLDFELMSRAVAVTRSDYQCGFDPDEMSFQNHTVGSMALLPYLGTYVGFPAWDYGKYSMRSAYTPVLGMKHFAYTNWEIPSAEKLQKLAELCKEYLEIRPYYCEDYYNLVEYELAEGSWGVEQENRVAPDETDWAAYQLHRKSDDSGVVLAFRREKSPYPVAVLSLHALGAEEKYVVTNADTGESFEKTGKELTAGLNVELPEKRSSVLLKYRRI